MVDRAVAPIARLVTSEVQDDLADVGSVTVFRPFVLVDFNSHHCHCHYSLSSCCTVSPAVPGCAGTAALGSSCVAPYGSQVLIGSPDAGYCRLQGADGSPSPRQPPTRGRPCPSSFCLVPADLPHQPSSRRSARLPRAWCTWGLARRVRPRSA